MKSGQISKKACKDCKSKKYEVRYYEFGYLGMLPLCRECAKFREDEPYL